MTQYWSIILKAYEYYFIIYKVPAKHLRIESQIDEITRCVQKIIWRRKYWLGTTSDENIVRHHNFWLQNTNYRQILFWRRSLRSHDHTAFSFISYSQIFLRFMYAMKNIFVYVICVHIYPFLKKTSLGDNWVLVWTWD